MKSPKLIPEDIRVIIKKELPSYWLREVSNKINDYVYFGNIFDIGIEPNMGFIVIYHLTPIRLIPSLK